MVVSIGMKAVLKAECTLSTLAMRFNDFQHRKLKDSMAGRLVNDMIQKADLKFFRLRRRLLPMTKCIDSAPCQCRYDRYVDWLERNA